jgi:hypothetical protein
MAKHIDPTPGNVPFEGTGPASIQGVEASDLPDKGRGSVDQNIGKHLKRKTPDRTGGTPQELGGDVGLRAMPDAADAADHGHRKHN